MVEDLPAIVARPGRTVPELGFEAIDSTHGSWPPDGAPSIIAHRQRPHPRSDLGSCTPRRATRRTAQVPRIVGSPKHEIIRRELATMIRGIGFGENRTSSRSEALDQDGVLLRHIILPQHRPKGRAYPFGFNQILNTHWHTT